VAVLWKQVAGYTNACLKALAARGVDIYLSQRAATPEVPFDPDPLVADWAGYCWDGEVDEGRLRREVEAFQPHALLVSSWEVGPYRRLSRAMGGVTLRLLCMDNQWLGTAKQWGGRMVSPLAIRPAYDVAFLPGERQAAFARRLGFGDDRILWNLYSCDHPAFSAIADASRAHQRRAFAFVGRLAPEKGVDVLARGYRRYRTLVADPWPLLICGRGSLEVSLRSLAGAELQGFVQPADLPGVFERATCLVLPSTFEPWGVVVHEAAAAGMAIICSTACGASSRLLVDGYNGLLVPPGDPEGLALAMKEVSQASGEALAAMSTRSSELAHQFTPELWADYLVDRIPRLRGAIGLPLP